VSQSCREAENNRLSSTDNGVLERLHVTLEAMLPNHHRMGWTDHTNSPLPCLLSFNAPNHDSLWTEHSHSTGSTLHRLERWEHKCLGESTCCKTKDSTRCCSGDRLKNNWNLVWLGATGNLESLEIWNPKRKYSRIFCTLLGYRDSSVKFWRFNNLSYNVYNLKGPMTGIIL